MWIEHREPDFLAGAEQLEVSRSVDREAEFVLAKAPRAAVPVPEKQVARLLVVQPRPRIDIAEGNQSIAVRFGLAEHVVRGDRVVEAFG